MNERSSKPGNQIAHMRTQGPGNFHQRIHRGGFLSAFNPTDEYSRKVGPFRQLFLTEAGFLAPGTNRLAKKATMLLAGMHGQLKKQGPNNIAMSLTTNFFLAHN
jgi:hypothetical protein